MSEVMNASTVHKEDMSKKAIESNQNLLNILIPTYNEAENIAELIGRLTESLSRVKYQVTIIDDNSPDETASIADGLAKTNANIKVFRRKRKMGLGSAILDGLKMSDGKIIAVMDADLQHPPELILKMLNEIEKGHDLVIASRYIDEARIEGLKYKRKLISKGATLMAHILLPKIRLVKDPISGYFMFNQSVIDGIKLNTKSYKILTEILAKGRYVSILELPFTFSVRKAGESKLGTREALSYIMYLIKLKFQL